MKANFRRTTFHFRTTLRRPRIMTTNMAAQKLFATVIRKGKTTIRTLGNKTAIGALHGRCETPAIEKQDRLFALLQSIINSLFETLRKNGRTLIILGLLGAHILNTHQRHLFIVHTGGKR